MRLSYIGHTFMCAMNTVSEHLVLGRLFKVVMFARHRGNWVAFCVPRVYLRFVNKQQRTTTNNDEPWKTARDQK